MSSQKACLQRDLSFLKNLILSFIQSFIYKENVQQSQKQNCLRRFKKYNIQRLYCGTVVLVSYCYGEDNV